MLAGAYVAAAGLAVMAEASRRHARGGLDAARRLGRIGGFIAAGGSAVLAGGGGFLVGLLALLSGYVALLGGLSGKPRPAVWFAAALLAAAVAVALAPPW